MQSYTKMFLSYAGDADSAWNIQPRVELAVREGPT
jgi:hypothetical protein